MLGQAVNERASGWRAVCSACTSQQQCVAGSRDPASEASSSWRGCDTGPGYRLPHRELDGRALMPTDRRTSLGCSHGRVSPDRLQEQQYATKGQRQPPPGEAGARAPASFISHIMSRLAREECLGSPPRPVRLRLRSPATSRPRLETSAEPTRLPLPGRRCLLLLHPCLLDCLLVCCG